MSWPDSAALEALWDGSLGDTITIKTASDGTADSYGEKARSYSAGTSAKGRAHILKADEVNKEFGYLRPGDAIMLLKLTATVASNDRLTFNSITYEVMGIVVKRTHQEIACRRVD